jgi:hypothetical protein
MKCLASSLLDRITTYEYNKLCYPAVSEHVIRHKNLVASHGEPLDLANGYMNILESHRIGRDAEHVVQLRSA